MSSVGDGAVAGGIKPVYNYTWLIEQLFGSNIGRNSILTLAKDATLPSYTATKEEVPGAAINYKYASGIQWDDVKITFYHIRAGGTDVLSVLHRWRANVWTPELGLQPANKYKANSKITVYGNDWEYVYAWKLIGSWPQSIKEGDLTYTSSDVKVVEVVVSYDWAEIEQQSVGAATPSTQSTAQVGPRFTSFRMLP